MDRQDWGGSLPPQLGGSSPSPDIPGGPLLSSTVQANTAGRSSAIPAPSPSPLPSPRPIPDYAAMFGAQHSTPPVQPMGRPTPQAAPQANDEDEWSFSSALPPGSQTTKPNEIVVMDSNLRVVVEVNRPSPGGPILLKARFSNNASQPIQDLTFQMAVTKVRTPCIPSHLHVLTPCDTRRIP